MTVRGASLPARIFFGAFGLWATLCSAAPAVRWCPVAWEDISLSAYLACDAGTQSDCAMDRSDTCRDRKPVACAAAGGCGNASDQAPASAASGSPATTTHGNAYCLGDPAMARGVRSSAPHVDVPSPVVAAMTVGVELEPPTMSKLQREPLDRGPPWAATRKPQPPVRAPPPAL